MHSNCDIPNRRRRFYRVSDDERATLLAAFPRFLADIIYNRRRDARELEQKRLFVARRERESRNSRTS